MAVSDVMDPDQLAAFRAAVTSYERARLHLRGGLLALLRRLWRGVDDLTDQGQVDAYTRQVASLVATAQQREADLVAAHLRRTLAVQGVRVPLAPARIPAEPRGVDPEVVAERPVRQARRLIMTGLDELEARDQAERRALVAADTDLTLGMREGARSTLLTAAEAWDEVIGYRRVIHPETSAGGTCGLCIAASDRIYSVGELLPIHGRCHCTIEAVVAGRPDPGRALNRADLKALYAAAGSTRAADLAKVRYRVHEHGELGQVLADARHDFRGPSEAAADTDPAEQPDPAPVLAGA